MGHSLHYIYTSGASALSVVITARWYWLWKYFCQTRLAVGKCLQRGCCVLLRLHLLVITGYPIPRKKKRKEKSLREVKRRAQRGDFHLKCSELLRSSGGSAVVCAWKSLLVSMCTNLAVLLVNRVCKLQWIRLNWNAVCGCPIVIKYWVRAGEVLVIDRGVTSSTPPSSHHPT